MNLVDKMKPGKSYVRLEKRKGENEIPAYDIWVGSFARDKENWWARHFPFFAKDTSGSLYAEVFAKKMDEHYLLMREGCFGLEKVFGIVDSVYSGNSHQVLSEVRDRLRKEALRLGKIAAQEYHYKLVET